MLQHRSDLDFLHELSQRSLGLWRRGLRRARPLPQISLLAAAAGLKLRSSTTSSRCSSAGWLRTVAESVSSLVVCVIKKMRKMSFVFDFYVSLQFPYHIFTSCTPIPKSSLRFCWHRGSAAEESPAYLWNSAEGPHTCAVSVRARPPRALASLHSSPRALLP